MKKEKGKTTEKLSRLDLGGDLREKLLPLCRLAPGEIWKDPEGRHRVGALDCTDSSQMKKLAGRRKADLALHDPPYNVKVGKAGTDRLFKISIDEYINFSRLWVENSLRHMKGDSHFYAWLGMDVRDGFQPLPEFVIMLRGFEELAPRNFITLRNQRGYGTQKNWMWVRQELLHYTRGEPPFRVVYTDIPKTLKGYYKKVGGRVTENSERGKSDTIRPGNVWVDVQQIFYRMEENVPGCYAQKPLKAVERIIETSCPAGGLVLDFFSHSGATLIAGERLGRRVFTSDIDPVFAEITIRRLERFRETGKTGWQWNSPFPEVV